MIDPLGWIKAAHDLVSKTEKSSGFRPYLIYLLVVFGASIVMIFGFPQSPPLWIVACSLMIVSALAFIILFGIKAFRDPDFCRSELHVQRLKKIELEKLGSEAVQIDAEVLDRAMLTEAVPDPPALSQPSSEEGTR
jgi:hypothetical protein